MAHDVSLYLIITQKQICINTFFSCNLQVTTFNFDSINPHLQNAVENACMY